MNKFFKYILMAVAVVAMAAPFTSCSEDKLGPSIFPEVPEGSEVDPDASTYQLDKWLKENFLDVYNLQFMYKYVDVGTDMNYNLLPADYNKSVDIAVLTKYLWFDSYEEVTGSPEFLKQYGPRILMLVGSPAYNPNTGTILLGLAEGGIKVTLFRVNDARTNNFADLNEYLFRTMHHEFSHILHQTKTIPQEFQLISTGKYDASNWQARNDGEVNSLGFFTPYASSEVREDFAETIANYITRTDEELARIRKNAARGWIQDPGESEDANGQKVFYCFFYYTNNEANPDNLTYVKERDVNEVVDESGNVSYYHRTLKDDSGNPLVVYPVPDEDGVDGVAVLEQKLQIVRNWFQDEWNIDLDKLREVVQRRQLNFDLEALRQQVYGIGK